MPVNTIRYVLCELNTHGVIIDQTQEFVLLNAEVPLPSRDVLIAIFRVGFQSSNQHIAMYAPRMEDWIYSFKLEDEFIDLFSQQGKVLVERYLDGQASEITMEIQLPPADHNVFDSIKNSRNQSARRRKRSADDDEPEEHPLQRRRIIARRIQLRAPTTHQFDAHLDDAAIYQNNIQFNHCLTNRARDAQEFPMDYEFINLDRLPQPFRINYVAAQIAIIYAELVEGNNPILNKWRSPWLGRGKLNVGNIWNIARGHVQSGKTAAAVIWFFFDIFRGLAPCVFVRNKGGDQHMARIVIEFVTMVSKMSNYFEDGVDQRFLAENTANTFQPSAAFSVGTYMFIQGKHIRSSWSPCRDRLPIFLDRYNKDQVKHARGFIRIMKQFNGFVNYTLVFDEDDEGIVSIDGTDGTAQIESFVTEFDFIDETDDIPNPDDVCTLRNQARCIVSITATITNLLIVGRLDPDGSTDNAATFCRRLIQLPKNDALYKGYNHPLFDLTFSDNIDTTVRHTEGHCYAIEREPGIRMVLEKSNERFRLGTSHTSVFICSPSTRLNDDRISLAKMIPTMVDEGCVAFIISENLTKNEFLKGKMAFYVSRDGLLRITPQQVKNRWEDLQAVRPLDDRVFFRDVEFAEEEENAVIVTLKNHSQRTIANAYKFSQELSMLITGQQFPFVACVTGSSYGSRCHTYKDYEHKYPITDAYVSWKKEVVKINNRPVETVNWVNIIQAMRMFSCDSYDELQRNIVMPRTCEQDYHDAFCGDQVLSVAASRVDGTLEEILAQLPAQGRYTEMLKNDAALHLTKSKLMKACKERVNQGAREAQGPPDDSDTSSAEGVDDNNTLLNDSQKSALLRFVRQLRGDGWFSATQIYDQLVSQELIVRRLPEEERLQGRRSTDYFVSRRANQTSILGRIRHFLTEFVQEGHAELQHNGVRMYRFV